MSLRRDISKKLNWYSVKTLYLKTITGKAKGVKLDDTSLEVLYEERVVLFRARNFDHAIKKAEVEAVKYAKYAYVNRFNQKVKNRYLFACDAFLITDTFEENAEIYSFTEVMQKAPLIKDLISAKIGIKRSMLKDKKLREKFLHK